MKRPPTRIVLAKVGLDGHDRGVRVLARAFRDAGMEVIYTGLWQTPAATAKAAIEEDADILGLSFHSAAHLTLAPLVIEELNKRGRGDIPVALGGIIPHDDISAMTDAGVAAIFEPESSLQHIIEQMNRLGDASHERRRTAVGNGLVDDWITRSRCGDQVALARVLSWIENGADADDVARRLGGGVNNTIVVGITGAPGVGKSTLIGRLLAELRRRDKQVGVVAIDPASPITQGALLGDRARMTVSAEDPGVFVRSSASRGALGGLAPATGLMIQAMAVSSLDVLIVETVGAGQNDYSVRDWASPLVLLLMPGTGDELQLAKAGITEVADIFVINKADLTGADRLEGQIIETLGRDRPVVQTIASKGKGIPELADAILEFAKDAD